MDTTLINDQHVDFMGDFSMGDMSYDHSALSMDHGQRQQSTVHHGDEQTTIGQDEMDALQKIIDSITEGATPSTGSATPLTTNNNSQTDSLPITTELLNQMKVHQFNQLQHMQNQISHHQMELRRLFQHLNNSSPDMNSFNTDGMGFPHGLPTPLLTHDITPQIHPDVQHSHLVSPMIPVMDTNMYDTPSGPVPSSASTSQHTSPNIYPQAMSAPARLVFLNNVPLPSPTIADFDPMPSPFLEPMHSQVVNEDNRKRLNREYDMENPSRKRQSPGMNSTGKRASSRGQSNSNSSSNTPLTGAILKRRRSTSTAPTPSTAALSTTLVADTPSPVDLSMPPPSTPSGTYPDMSTDSNGNLVPVTAGLAPVTPSSVMGLHTPNHTVPSAKKPTVSFAGPPRVTRAKAPAKSKAVEHTDGVMAQTQATTRKKAGTTRATGSLGPGSLKTILPDGVPPVSLGTANATSSKRVEDTFSPISPNGIINGQPVPQVRKTSHKAAEQKRRDSLKTSFDDLRLLLPPIPLPSGDGYMGGDEPLLPGALPPRGPPKGEPEGPNRQVSKLQLLRCGNAFIRTLKGRIERRDDEIQNLRNEVMRLRGCGGSGPLGDVMEEIDLQKDLDAVEREAENMKRLRIQMEVEDEEQDEEG